MGFVYFVALILGGILGAANLIIAKKPDAKQYIDKLAPYAGFIGIIMFILGVWGVIDVLRALPLLKLAPLFWILFLVAVLTLLLLGFLLGFALITKYALSKNEAAMAKGEAIRLKLAGYQGLLGIIAIIVAIVFLILYFTL